VSYAVEVSLWLDHLKIEQEAELAGDQLYFYVLKQDIDHHFSDKLTPIFPFSYTKANLVNFKPTILWKEELLADEKVKLSLSLLDREVPPWMEDELLAVINVDFQIVNDELQASWNGLEFTEFLSRDHTLLKQLIHIKHNKGQYNVALRLEVHQ
jgi:hypothetical protein